MRALLRRTFTCGARWPVLGLSMMMLLTGVPVFGDTIDPHILLDQPTSISAFNGTTRFSGSDFDGVQQRYGVIDVDFAVFAPNHFPNTLAPFPHAANEYVYAYQIFNIGDGDPLKISLPLTTLSVDSFEGAITTSVGQALPVDPEEEIPSSFYFVFSDASKYFFFFPELAVGQRSTVLYLTSPYAPDMIQSYVQVGSALPTSMLPSPSLAATNEIQSLVPTPSAFGGGAVCVLALSFAHVLNKRLHRSNLGRS